MQTNGISLFDQQQPEPAKKDRKTAFVLGGIVVLGIAGALGLGFVLGGHGDDARSSSVDGVSVSPTQSVQVSPTAGAASQSGNTAGDTAQDASGAGSTDAGTDVGDAPAATNTSEPAPTETPEPPASTATATPEDPTSTPTATPTSGPCAWCPDLDLVDPGVVLIDFVAPTIAPVSYKACVSNLHVYFETNEHADMWVVYSVDGGLAHVSGIESGQVFEKDIALGAAFVTVKFQLHAKDDNGNERVSAAYETFAGICLPPDFVPDLDLGF